jgi:hypothetical protein
MLSKFINNINKYCYKSSSLIDNIPLFIKLNNGIEWKNGNKCWYKNGLVYKITIAKMLNGTTEQTYHPLFDEL